LRPRPNRQLDFRAGPTPAASELVADYRGTEDFARPPNPEDAVTATDTAPTADELMMIEYQEAVLGEIAARFGLPVAEVGVMAAAFLSSLSGRDLAEVRRAARRGYREWAAAEAPAVGAL
jgi:hypothetical protein